MSRLICELNGVRGRSIAVYDTKCVITTDVTLGSLIPENALDGEKTIFYKDVIGIQFKRSGLAIGYLQLETPSIQMNNRSSNLFSENTFTFQSGANGITNELIVCLKDYIIARVEGYKYGFDEGIFYEPSEIFMQQIKAIDADKPAVQKKIDVQVLEENKYIFRCERCVKLFSGIEESTLTCSNCGIPLVQTEFTKGQWKMLSSEEKEKIKASWTPAKRKFF